SDLKGSYQVKNIQTAIQSIEQLKSQQFNISDESIKNGLLNVVKNTGLLGRWQILKQSPKVICDTAHNREGLEIVISQLKRETFNKLHIVFGVVNDKDLDTIVDLLPINASYYLCKPNIQRGLDSNKLLKHFKDKNLISQAYNSVNEAYKKALVNANSNDVIYIGGSTFVVAEII
ncbi:MAG: bifunctional folylpolyglutamate synthase/dihydrofolate synthase, partial [Lacinutrix sp.]